MLAVGGEGLELLLASVETVSSLVFGLKDDMRLFVPAMRGFLSMAFHPLLLVSRDKLVLQMIDEVNCSVYVCVFVCVIVFLCQCVDRIFEVGVVKVGVVNLLVNHVCDTWKRLFQTNPQGI